MLEELKLRNFKAFRNIELDLKPFTLLSGLNSVGKSTILQSLLVLRQSYLESRAGNTVLFPLLLDGEYIDLGNAKDVFYRERGREVSDDNFLEIAMTDSIAGRHQWRYTRPAGVNFFDDPEFSGDESLALDITVFSTSGAFQYLQAERIGPRVFTEISDNRVARRDLGKAGEYTIHYLATEQDSRIPYSGLLYDEETENNRLIDQVIKWMGTISPNTEIVTEVDRDLGVTRLVIDDSRATNVGFGISYVLPVLVAVLSSDPEDIILLENPEAHLHPQGQARMGELLARAAATGIQIICETHSDHILNGMRYAAKQGTILPEQVAIHHFAIEEGNRQHYHIRVDEDGDLTPWPEGFFDEFRKMLRKLI